LMALFCTTAPLCTTMLDALPTLMPELLPVLIVVPDATDTAMPAGVARPAPTVAVWSLPVQLIVLAFVSVVHAADAGKLAVASEATVSSTAPFAVEADLAWPRPNSEATVQSASALFQMTRKILFMI